MSRVVVQVAKASKVVSMISFDLETLEELGCEFHQQDKERTGEGNSKIADWEPDMRSFTTFLEHFFTVSSNTRDNQGAWQPNRQVLSTILDAVEVKQTARCPNLGERDEAGALLIHIMDCGLVNQALAPGMKHTVLTRIAELVRERREQGEAVAILLSTKSHWYQPGKADFIEIGATSGSTVTASRDKILDWDQRTKMRRGIVNTQRLRRLMRRHLPSNLVCSELLKFYSDWTSANRAQTYRSFGKELWSSGDVEKAITVLMGRGWRISKARSQMSFADIRDVLQCLSLFDHVESDCKSQATEEMEQTEETEETEETGESEEEGEASEFHTSSSPNFSNFSHAFSHTYR